jgi:hypothetical protein
MDAKNVSKMLTVKNTKSKYYCDNCDYGTSKKSDWMKHIQRKKHLKKFRNWTQVMNGVDFSCNFCDKHFIHKSSASRHSKICNLNPYNIVENDANDAKNVAKSPSQIINSKKHSENSVLVTKTEENIKLKEEVKELKKELEHQEIKELKNELKRKDEIIDIYKNKSGDTYNTNNTNNINNTQNISINVYLNKDCKNAMNLTDFVDQIQVQLEDVMYQKDFGAIAGIQNILQKQLGNLDPTDRPIHCTDGKRMQFYVKEDDKWEKDTGDKAAKDIRIKIKNKSIMAMKEWEDANPYFANNPKLADEYNKIVHGILEGYGDEKKFAKQIQEVKKRIATYVSIKDAIAQRDNNKNKS